jgi:membrane-bound serine protease (ClpP class)
MLMFIGVLGVMVEFYHPGMLIPGAVGLMCLAIAFFAGNLLGVVEFIDIALLAVGVVLILVEVFVIPGFGVVGILGLLAFLAGCFLTLQETKIPVTVGEIALVRMNFQAFLGGLVMTGLAFFLLVRFLPQSPWIGRIVLQTEQRVEDGYTVASSARVALLGSVAEAITTLRPSGKVTIGDDQHDAVAEGSFIEKGTVVEVIEVAGSHVVVRPRRAETGEQPA